jgi:hypothetical protein
LRAIRSVSSSASPRLIRPISFAVASATSGFPCSSARRKTVRAWPCEVDAHPPRGRDDAPESRGSPASDPLHCGLQALQPTHHLP